jgi:uncharacterized membrane protein YgcG
LEDILKKTQYIIISLVGLILVLTTGLVVAQESQAKPISRAVLKIDRLTGGESFAKINSGFTPLEGYSGIGANLFRKLIAIDFTEPLTSQKISDMLSLMGYPGKLESVDIISEQESFAYIESKRSGFGSCGGGGTGSSGGCGGGGGSSCGVNATIPQPTKDL